MDRVLLGPLGLGPEGFLVEIVLRSEPGNVVLRLVPEQAAGLPLAGERAVEAAERLDPDEVAQHEHVERDLELELGLDLGRRVDGLPGLVVLDDPAGAERVEVDPVDLPRDREAVDLEPALELGRRALRPERDLETSRDEPEGRLCLAAHEVLEVAPQALLELAALKVP